MPKYWLISDRNNGGIGTERNVAGLSYFVSDKEALTDINNWKPVSPTQFRTLLKAAADAFPALTQAQNEDQSHVTILIHGFNVSFQSSTGFYQDVCGKLCAEDLTNILSELYDWLLKQQQVAIKFRGDPQKVCKAKVSVIAHSMGNYLLQKAMAAAWTRKGQPLLTTLINQLVMA